MKMARMCVLLTRCITMTQTLTCSGSITMKNLNGTSDKNCSCDSWLNHWKKFSDSSGTPKCFVEDCNVTAEVGAHVILPNLKNESYRSLHFIAPMCKTHNNAQGKTLKSKPNPVFVSANKAKTCEA